MDLKIGAARGTPKPGSGRLLALGAYADSQLRGLSLFPGGAWASGSNGAVIRRTGKRRPGIIYPAGAEALEFRGIYGFDADNVLAMSAGIGDQSQIWRSADGGVSWQQVLINTEATGFWNSMTFANEQVGYVLGDPVAKRFVVLVTSDCGQTWKPVPQSGMPLARHGEGAFAASNGCIAIGSAGQIAFCTGGGGTARAFLSSDGGVSFSAFELPIAADSPSRGAFACAFGRDDELWICGGDYAKPDWPGVNLVRLSPRAGDAEVVPAPAGFLSSVAIYGRTLLATGLAGTVLGRDGTFQRIATSPFNTVRFRNASNSMLAGPAGTLGLWRASA